MLLRSEGTGQAPVCSRQPGVGGAPEREPQKGKSLHEESLELSRELGDKLIVAESLEGLACSAARGEEYGRPGCSARPRLYAKR